MRELAKIKAAALRYPADEVRRWGLSYGGNSGAEGVPRSEPERIGFPYELDLHECQEGCGIFLGRSSNLKASHKGQCPRS